MKRSRGIITLQTQEKIFAEAALRGVSKFAVFVEPVNDDRCVLSGRECFVDSNSGASTLGGGDGCVRDSAASRLLRDDICANVDN